MQESTRERILEFLIGKPRGSTISEVSDSLDISRQTASKYLEVLVNTEKIDRREVGSAKLHYLEQENLESFTGAETG